MPRHDSCPDILGQAPCMGADGCFKASRSSFQVHTRARPGHQVVLWQTKSAPPAMLGGSSEAITVQPVWTNGMSPGKRWRCDPFFTISFGYKIHYIIFSLYDKESSAYRCVGPGQTVPGCWALKLAASRCSSSPKDCCGFWGVLGWLLPSCSTGLLPPDLDGGPVL